MIIYDFSPWSGSPETLHKANDCCSAGKADSLLLHIRMKFKREKKALNKYKQWWTKLLIVVYMCE
jgi:hypothetical protein